MNLTRLVGTYRALLRRPGYVSFAVTVFASRVTGAMFNVTGVLLGLDNPWGLVAEQLGRAEEEIKKTLDGTVKRRNDIVHRADRSQDDPAGTAQEIGFPWAKQAVETIRVVCLALDDLVSNRIKELKQHAATTQAQVTA